MRRNLQMPKKAEKQVVPTQYIHPSSDQKS